jgi:hypothetical protein
MCVILAYVVSPILVAQFLIEQIVGLSGTSMGNNIGGVELVVVVVTNYSPWPMTFHVQYWLIGGWGATNQPTQFSLAPFGTSKLDVLIEPWEVVGPPQNPLRYLGGRTSVVLGANVTILYFTKTFVSITTSY